ncbi:hypothetical protein NT2_05_03030 [Caenibius tardaugens NBRC 16725]|uniref:Peptidase C51 domain-containing protein n=1 Tax=Caenibius tardaugens NBRC 16725 TaxID=1219035 RepID=U2YLU8_9SPHN|nr:CHAP domain-containing protein [Caenibius tardaugens]AZI36719.1 CHAP domain-containing protein [Caenibius tardaugens NBRC 16725]GAD49382.1 hypothetical protein NT2_05_03030 [Caenibius tardaugens NBRC 16725]
MKIPVLACLACLASTLSVPATAQGTAGFAPANLAPSYLAATHLAPPYLECVPYARQVSGISIYGDAHTWWDQAKGRYPRGNRPRVGAVMAFEPHGNMRLGHVAAVSRVIDSRTVLLRHANWSPIDGRRGQIEDNVRAVDVSSANDWSAVRVWYAPIQALGGTAWPVNGFIYRDGAKDDGAQDAAKRAQPAKTLAKTASAQTPPKLTAAQRRTDPIGAIIAGARR